MPTAAMVHRSGISARTTGAPPLADACAQLARQARVPNFKLLSRQRQSTS